MTQEIGDFDQNIANSRILRVSVPEPLIEPFQIADSVAQGQYYLIGSSVRKCIVGETDFPDDVDFLGAFDVNDLMERFGDRAKRMPIGETVKVYGNNEIDFMCNTDIVGDLRERDITISLMCMDREGVIYDPLNYIQDLKDRRIRIEDADRKIKIEPWRIMRVLRFAATLGYEVESLTREACIKNVGMMDLENTDYVMQKLMSVDPAITKRVLELAEEYGILDNVGKLISSRNSE